MREGRGSKRRSNYGPLMGYKEVGIFMELFFMLVSMSVKLHSSGGKRESGSLRGCGIICLVP